MALKLEIDLEALSATSDEGLLEFMCKIGGPKGNYRGKLLCVHPPNQETTVNITVPFGKGAGILLSLMSKLGKWGFTVLKRDESFYISQVDQGYYQLTQRYKEELEAKLKEGLASVARAIADYELVAHDRRKYEEFVKFAETNDDHSLRSLFVHEVDIHTDIQNQPKALLTIVQRWPTIITDFFNLGKVLKENEEPDPKTISERLKISMAEAILLATKEKLYRSWKETFIKEVKERYKRILSLERARLKSIQEYREMLKPIIVKYKSFKEDYGEILNVKELSMGQAISEHKVVLWAFQTLKAHDIRKKTRESEKFIKPLDDFTKRVLIFNEKNGLKKYYPFINKEWLENAYKKVKEMLSEDWPYYEFFRIVMYRFVVKLPNGAQFDDIVFDVKAYFMSQNVLLVKLLEYEAEKTKLEKYINELLGVEALENKEYKSIEEIYNELVKKWKGEKDEKKKTSLQKIKENWENLKFRIGKLSDMLGFTFMFAKLGPYEPAFKDRVTNQFLKVMGGDFADIVSLIKSYGNVGG